MPGMRMPPLLGEPGAGGLRCRLAAGIWRTHPAHHRGRRLHGGPPVSPTPENGLTQTVGTRPGPENKDTGDHRLHRNGPRRRADPSALPAGDDAGHHRRRAEEQANAALLLAYQRRRCNRVFRRELALDGVCPKCQHDMRDTPGPRSTVNTTGSPGYPRDAGPRHAPAKTRGAGGNAPGPTALVRVTKWLSNSSANPKNAISRLRHPCPSHIPVFGILAPKTKRWNKKFRRSF